MKKLFCTVAMIFLCSFFLPGHAQADGMGPFVAYAGDISSSLEVPEFVLEELHLGDDSIKAVRQDSDIFARLVHFTLGFLYDGAPMREKLFNYRIAAGFDIAAFGNMDVNFPTVADENDNMILAVQKEILEASLSSPSLVGITVNNTFGFSLIRNQTLKWWAGPCVRLNANYYRPDVPNSISSSTVTAVLGAGVETGVNYAITPGVALSVDLGFTYNALGYLLRSMTDNAGLVWGHGSCVFLQFGVLFNRGPDRT